MPLPGHRLVEATAAWPSSGTIGSAAAGHLGRRALAAGGGWCQAGPRHGARAPVGRRLRVWTSSATQARCPRSHPVVSSAEAVW